MKTKILVIAAFVLTFAAGVLSGAIIVRQFAWPPFPRAERGFPGERHRPLTLEVLKPRLNLSDAQSQQVQRIIAKHHEQLRRQLGQIRPKSRMLIKQMVTEIDSVLTLEQRKKFREEFPMLWKMPNRPREAPEDTTTGGH